MTDVIVLSDSDEENDTMVCPPSAFDNTTANGSSFPLPPVVLGILRDIRRMLVLAQVALVY